MGTVFNGQAEDIQFKLSAGDGISITGDNSNVISALRTATSLEMTSPGMYFVPASTATMPNGTQGCGMLLVMEGDVGGGSEGYIQYLVMYGSAFTRSYYQGWGNWTQISDSSIASLSVLASGGQISGKGLSANDYTDADKAIVSGHAAEIEALQEACGALEAGKLGLPLYDMANNNADTLTTPGIYATSYAGPQNFPSIDPDAMPLLIVAEAGRMPDTSGGAPDFSNSKTLLQILIYNSGRIYSRYKIAGDGDMADWSWSAWSTKGSTNDYTNADKAIVSDVGRKWRKLADTTLTEAVGSVTFSEDMDGAAFSCTNFRIFIKYPTIEGQTGKSSLKMTSSSLQATHYISFYNALVAGDTYNETIKINLDIFSDVVDVLWFVGQEPAISSPASIMSSIRNGVIKCPSGAISDLTIACATSGWTLPVGTEIRIYGR